PRFAKAHFHRGLALYASGEREQGIEAARKALELEPGFGTDAFHRGMKAHAEGDHAAALHGLEMVSATEVDDILFHYRLGDDLYRRGMYMDAAAEYKKALELNPNYADIHNHLGIALSADKEYEQAVSAFKKALETNPAFVDAH